MRNKHIDISTHVQTIQDGPTSSTSTIAAAADDDLADVLSTQ